MSMILHIFNPEHDLALAANMSNFTPPLAGRALRSELSFLPALWASENDAILVDDVEAAYSEYSAFKKKAGIQRHNPMFVTKKPGRRGRAAPCSSGAGQTGCRRPAGAGSWERPSSLK